MLAAVAAGCQTMPVLPLGLLMAAAVAAGWALQGLTLLTDSVVVAVVLVVQVFPRLAVTAVTASSF